MRSVVGIYRGVKISLWGYGELSSKHAPICPYRPVKLISSCSSARI